MCGYHREPSLIVCTEVGPSDGRGMTKFSLSMLNERYPWDGVWEFQWGIVEGPRTHPLKASYLLAGSVLLKLMSSTLFELDRRIRLLGQIASSISLFRLRQLGGVSRQCADAPTPLLLWGRGSGFSLDLDRVDVRG